jgi:hypothetical protein
LTPSWKGISSLGLQNFSMISTSCMVCCTMLYTKVATR